MRDWLKDAFEDLLFEIAEFFREFGGILLFVALVVIGVLKLALILAGK